MDSNQTQNFNQPNTGMQDNLLEQMVKTKFRLFQGLRDTEEDQKIYDKVINYCFDETIKFLSENLTEEDLDNLLKDMESSKTDQEKGEVFKKYYPKIENYNTKINARINGLLNNLLLNGLKKKT